VGSFISEANAVRDPKRSVMAICSGPSCARAVCASAALWLLANCGGDEDSTAKPPAQTTSPISMPPAVSMPVDATMQRPSSMPADMPSVRGGAAAPKPNPMQAGGDAPAMPLPAGEAGSAPGPVAPVAAADEIPVCANSILEPGDSNGMIDIGSTNRSYIVHVPPMYDGKTPMPLILDFPALTQTASGQRGASGNAALADQEGIVVVYPNGIGGAFNICPTDNPKTDCRCCTGARDVDDLGFALELVKKMKREGCIDPKRVYATGYSMGGGMDYFLACYAADVFAAVAASSFDMVVMDQIPCVPSRPITVISSRGTADPVVEYGGSVSSFGLMFQGAVGSWEMWKAINGCTGEPEDTGMGCQSYKHCAAPGVEATLCTVQGGSHSPGSAPLLWSHIKDSALP
jgi:polyhydroxybutyrate depolymerase